MENILDLIWAANVPRQRDNISRRLNKLSEEVGETAQAYLSVTSAANPKKKTWDDVREEAVDSVIVALDIALTRTPDEDDLSDEAVRAKVQEMVMRKLDRWNEKLARNTATTGVYEDDV